MKIMGQVISASGNHMTLTATTGIMLMRLGDSSTILITFMQKPWPNWKGRLAITTACGWW